MDNQASEIEVWKIGISTENFLLALSGDNRFFKITYVYV